MASNRVSRKLTIRNLLLRMDLGKPYTMYALAAKFNVKTDDVKPFVMQCVDEGTLVVFTDGKNTKYRRPADGEAIQEAEPIELSVAAPPLPPDMVRVISDYDAEIAQRAQLAMLARGT